MSLWLSILIVIQRDDKVKVSQKPLPFDLAFVSHPHPTLAHCLPFVSMAWTCIVPKGSKIFQKYRYILLLLLLSSPWLSITWLKLRFDIHHWSISYPWCLQDHMDTVSHFQFGYFDLVNLVWPSQAQILRWWLRKQHGLHLFQTCPVPILRFQFGEFGPSSLDKWLLSLYYWLNDQILLQMVVILVLLEQCSVPGVVQD